MESKMYTDTALNVVNRMVERGAFVNNVAWCSKKILTLVSGWTAAGVIFMIPR
jgi:hypothetical protein